MSEMTVFVVSFGIPMVLITITSMFLYPELSSSSSDPFECGMEVVSSNRIPFHIHYYLVGVLFLIFDIEFVVSIPMLVFKSDYTHSLAVWGLYFFLMFAGLWLEVVLGGLDWKL